ncbi:MAG: hypothetical protein E7G69_15240, partial [Enterobacter sp.]|nr:hypothetical protein [Enterobacter sp.]
HAGRALIAQAMRDAQPIYGVAVDMSREASLEMESDPTGDSVSPTGTELVSMFQTNSVAIRAERWINWKRRRTAAVAVISGVNYGSNQGS